MRHWQRVVAAGLLAGLALTGLGFPAAANDETDAVGVHVVPGSNINLLARETGLPITVENPTAELVTVTVSGITESFRLEVLDDVTLSVPAQSSAVAQLPVRAIANGPITLRVWLTVDGERVGEDYVVGVNVNYDAEIFLVVTFGVLLFGLLVIGILRTSVRLRSRLVR